MQPNDPYVTHDEQFLLFSSKDEQEWNETAERIRLVRHGRLPPDWLINVMCSGLADAVAKRWGKPGLFQRPQDNQSFEDFILGQL